VADTVVCITNAYVFDQSLTTRSDHFLTGFTTTWTPSANLSNRFAVGWDFTDIQGITNLPFGFLTLSEGYFWDENTRHTKLSLDYSGTFQSGLFRLPLTSSFSWGGQVFRDRHRWTEIDVQNFAGPGEPTYTTGAELTYRNDLPSAVTNAGFFLQEQLGWRDRLFVTGGLRVDGSSAFGDDFGLQTYPKVGASYVLSDHDFWPKQWVETFKVRAALGESGKAPDAFAKLRTWTPVTGDENKPGFTPGDVGNAQLGPERTRELEGGFDMSFLSGRLGLELTAFQARTLDAIIPLTSVPSNGFLIDQFVNVGEVRNKGFELQGNAALLRTSKFEWRLRGNYSAMSSDATDLGGQDEIYTGLQSWVKEGKPFPAYYGKHLKNPNASAATTDPEIESDGLIGLVNPNRLWGVGTTLTMWNNVTLDAFVEHQGGHYVQNYTGYQNARRGVWQPCYATQEAMVRSWGPDKKAATADDVKSELEGITNLQLMRCAFSGFDIGYWTERGDFTKLRYVALTYNLPARLAAASNASITLSARNLFTWTDYTGADPEVMDVADQANTGGNTAGSFGRRDYYQIPQPRSFTLSLKFGF
jgi:outer membrane receptor protein involved in Fe transport